MKYGILLCKPMIVKSLPILGLILLVLSACGQAPDTSSAKAANALSPLVGNSYGERYFYWGQNITGKEWERIDFISETKATWNLSQVTFDGASTWGQGLSAIPVDLEVQPDGRVNAYSATPHSNANLMGSYLFRINAAGNLEMASGSDWSSYVVLPKRAPTFPN